MSDTWIATKLCDVETNDIGVRGITVDNNGIIYFTTDENVYYVKQDNINTEPEILLHIKDARLRGIIWNGNNILYICDNYNDRILSYSIDTGNLSTLVAWTNKDGNIKDDQLRFPYGIAMDRNGDLYITQEHCVRKINISLGTVITIAGSDEDGHKDGNATQATFDFPFGIAVSDDDTIYVADTFNYCIRKIKDGIVSTLAGTPGKKGHQDGLLRCSHFKYPQELVLDVDGNLLIGDWTEVRKVDLNQKKVTTLQGTQSLPIRSLAISNQFGLFAGGTNSIMKIENRWKWKRLIWIGHLKENPNDCLLATLPRDIIKEILQLMDLIDLKSGSVASSVSSSLATPTSNHRSEHVTQDTRSQKRQKTDEKEL